MSNSQQLPKELIDQLESLRSEFDALIAPLAEEQQIRRAQAQYMGKKGKVSALMKQMGKLPPEDRRSVGAAFNEVKTAITGAVEQKLEDLERAAAEADLARTIDVTLPGRQVPVGHTHLLTQVWNESVDIFAELGFELALGPQIETDFHSFEALAIPKDHPARDMQDTFYIGDDIVLRPHTSPVQIRTMLAHQPPVKIVAPGFVYRRDDDPTHSPMFSQIEGLLVDEGVRFSDLKGVLLHYVRRYFGRALDIRFRPSYFPFVEPGAEVDITCPFCGGGGCATCSQSGWMEILGAGMVDPRVLAACDIDPEIYSGFAFGLGIDRVAMIRYGFPNIRMLFDNDQRMLRQIGA